MDILKNIPLILFPVLSAILFKNLYLMVDPKWSLDWINNPGKEMYWQHSTNMIKLFLFCIIYAILTIFATLTIITPIWMYNKVRTVAFVNILGHKKFKEKVKNKYNRDDLFIQDFDGVYIKINPDAEKEALKNKKAPVKEVYTLTGK